MYQKVLVPLDGSKLAESVLPHVEAVAKGGAMKEIVFVQVLEPLLAPFGDGAISEEEIKQTRLEEETGAADYLRSILGRASLDSTLGSVQVLEGKPADVLADFASKNGFDLIIMSTHGRSGISRWVFGSTADRILRSACVPVLMVRAPGCVPGF